MEDYCHRQHKKILTIYGGILKIQGKFIYNPYIKPQKLSGRIRAALLRPHFIWRSPEYIILKEIMVIFGRHKENGEFLKR